MSMVGLIRSGVGLAALVALAACDIRPLTASELYGASASDGAAPEVAAPPDAMPDAVEAPAAEVAPQHDAGADAAGEAPARGCASACPVDQFCDELTSTCAPRTGAGMLSGVVRDECGNGQGLDALVGIAGHHTCSYAGKGSFFFSNLPLGKLKIAVAKQGYRLYDTTVTIVPGGVVHDVHLQRETSDGGADACAGPAPAQVACTCTTPTCQP